MSRFLSVALLFLFPGFLSAWSGPGHMIVAALAYQDLSPEQRQKATEILKNHDEIAKWEKEVPENDLTLDEGLVLFMGASKWPDEIKFGHSSWNHKAWHYVDHPVNPHGPLFEPSPAPQDDIVFAINLCVKSLKDPKVSANDKACWLSWLIHITGDITQPLHCSALVNDDFKAPEGDRGGNLIFVRAGSGKGVPLHKMWDDAGGTSKGFHAKQLKGYANEANKLGEEFKRESLAELNLHTTPEAWARESWQIAVDLVYSHGQLQYGRNPETAPLLPEGYTKDLKAVSLRRIAVAGYRLADLIRDVLSEE